MKITENAINCFEEDEADFGTKSALDTFIATIADDLDKHFRYSQRDFKREVKEYGIKVALSNLQWQIASRLMVESGAKSVKTTYRTK